MHSTSGSIDSNTKRFRLFKTAFSEIGGGIFRWNGNGQRAVWKMMMLNKM